MLDSQTVDLEMLSSALADQGGYEHRWLFDRRTGQTEFWSDDDPDDPEDDEEHLLRVEPLPSWVWYQDMRDFAEQVSDEQSGLRLGRALRGKGAFRRFKGKGAFRRFKDELHDAHGDLLNAWYAFRDARAAVRAVEWLWDNDLVSDESYRQFRAEHPDPPVP